MAAQPVQSEFEHNRFPCTLCEAHFGTPKESAEHRVSAHGKPEGEAYLCHACPCKFHSQEAAELHAGGHLRGAWSPEARKFPCTQKGCSGAFRTLYARRMHVDYDHAGTAVEGGRKCSVVEGCNFTQAAAYGLALHAIHEHGASISKKRSLENSVDDDATLAKRAKRTPAPALAPKPADIPAADTSTGLPVGWTDQEFESLLQENELDRAFAAFLAKEGAQFTSALLSGSAPAAPAARQAEVIDLTADETSPPPAAPTVPSAPQSAPLSLEEQRRNSADLEARQGAFLARQMADLREQEAATGLTGPDITADLKRRKHAANMQRWRANEASRRAYVPSAEAGQRLEQEKAEELARNAAKEAKKQASKEARKEKKQRLREEKKADKAAVTAREKEASPSKKVEASLAVEAHPSTASTKQDAAASDKSGEVSEEDHLASSINSPASRPQTPITSPEDDGSLVLENEDEESEYMRSKRPQKQVADQQAGEGEEDLEALLTEMFAQEGEGEVEEDLEALLTDALAQEDEQAVDGDDHDSLFGEESSLEELFGEGEDDAPAKPATPAPSAPLPARNLLCLPVMKRKD